MRGVKGTLAGIVLGSASIAIFQVAGCSSFTADDDTSPDAASDVSAADVITPSLDAGREAAFSDDFERNELVGPWTRSLSDTDGSGNLVALDTSQKRSGAKSLHAKVSAKRGYAFLEQSESLPFVSRVDLSIYADKGSQPGTVFAKVAYDNATEVNISLSTNGLQLSEQKPDGSFFSSSASVQIPRNEWVSLVWTIHASPARIHLTSPDHPTVVIDYPLETTDLGTSVKAVRIGIVFAAVQDAGSNLSIDDVAVY